MPEAGKSPESPTDDKVDVKPDGSDSSTDKGVKQSTTVLEHVMQAIGDGAPKDGDGDGDEGQSPKSATGGSDKADGHDESQGDTGKDGAPKGEGEDGEEDEPLGKVGKARLREVLSENKQLKPQAEAFQHIQTFVKSAGMSQQDLMQTLELGAFTNQAIALRNPEAAATALKALTPLIDQLRTVAGESLPADIQERLNGGHIDEPTAKELARARNADEARRLADQRRQEQEQAEAEAQRTHEHAAACGKAVSAWDQEWKRTDPDYQKKVPLVQREVRLLMAEEGYPRTPDEAVAQAKRARENVERDLKGILAGSRKPKAPAPSGGSGNVRPVPKTALEAAEAALKAGRS